MNTKWNLVEYDSTDVETGNVFKDCFNEFKECNTECKNKEEAINAFIEWLSDYGLEWESYACLNGDEIEIVRYGYDEEPDELIEKYSNLEFYDISDGIKKPAFKK